MSDAIHAIVGHVAGARIAEMPDRAIAAARTFILDTMGVGIAGSAGPMAGELVAAIGAMGSGAHARVWATGERLPATAAALCNAHRIHCQEFDCVHEAAVVHVMTIVLPAALAIAERDGGAGGSISGEKLIEAVVVGVDVAATLGLAASSGLRFFRPATAGALGGVAAIGRILGLPPGQLLNAFSIAYGQIGGTMQAHTEGSGLLALQMGFAARNAVTACDLATAGFTGPERILEGDFGYFRMIEDGGDIAAATAALGRTWRIAEVAHKPYPSGRATHGIIDGCLALSAEHGIDPDRVVRLTLSVPPLIKHLVGRPPLPNMAINYARLCARYAAACALIGGRITLDDFAHAACRRPTHLALAERIALDVRRDEDPNALTPIGIEIELAGGHILRHNVSDVFGTPANPMSRDAQLEKFHANVAGAATPLPPGQAGELVAAIDALPDMADVRRLVDLAVA